MQQRNLSELMKKSWKNTFQFVILLIIGVLLIRFSLDKLSINDLFEQLKTGNYIICVPVFFVSATGYLFRVLRWRMMLSQMGEKSRISSLYASLCMGYTVSFVIPRLGELSRALIIKKTDNVKVDYTLLSIVAERLYDMLMLIILAVLNFIVFNQLFLKLISFEQFFNTLPSIGLWIWLLLLILILAGSISIRYFVKLSWWANLILRYKPVVQGLKSSSSKAQFWFLTIGIWFCYYLMTYLWFFLFDETSNLTWQNALLIMTVGSFGRSIPVQGGGMGAYHFIVSRAFVVMGLSIVTGNAMAIVIHGAQAVFTFITGIVSYLWMLYDVRSKKDILQSN